MKLLKGSLNRLEVYTARGSLTPYILSVCTEYLGRYLPFMSNSKSNIGNKIAKEAPKVPYFMFVDVCLIFYGPTKRARRKINDIPKIMRRYLIN